MAAKDIQSFYLLCSDDENSMPIKWQHLSPRKASQAAKRGWTDAEIQNVLDNPAETKVATDYSTIDSATVYYKADGHYVIRNDATGVIFQTSNTGDPKWVDPFNQVVRPRP